MNDSFLKRIIAKPPPMFPWVALFHVLMLLYSIWIYHEFPFPSEYWVGALWVLLLTIAWVFICDLRRWAAFLYLGLTILNIILRFTLSSQTDLAMYTHSFFPIDVLFCFFILFYFKRFS